MDGGSRASHAALWWDPNADSLFQATSSLTSNAVSSVAAGAGLLLLMDSLVALGTASQQCDSEKDYLSSLPYSEYYYSTVKDCLLTSASLTGALVVMLIFTVLELLLSAYASILWWKQVYSNNPGCAFSLSQSWDHIQHGKKSSRSQIRITLGLRGWRRRNLVFMATCD